jgi:hypothetical protein
MPCALYALYALATRQRCGVWGGLAEATAASLSLIAP